MFCVKAVRFCCVGGGLVSTKDLFRAAARYDVFCLGGCSKGDGDGDISGYFEGCDDVLCCFGCCLDFASD